MPINVRLISITFNQPGFQPLPPAFVNHGAPFGPVPIPPPFPGGIPGQMIPPPPQPIAGVSATVNIQIDSDHGSMSLPFTVPYNPPDLNALHAAAVQAATQYFNEIAAQISRV